MEEKSLKLLKVDSRGRVRVSRQRREELLAEYDRGGMSAASFAEWAGIKYPTFAWWLQERRREAKKVTTAEKAPAMEWVEAVVETGSGRAGEGGLEIEMPGGVKMRVFDQASAGLAARIVTMVTGRSGC